MDFKALYFTLIKKVLSVMTGLVVTLMGGLPAVPEGETKDSYTGLKDVYADYFDIGTCMSSSFLNDTELTEFIIKNYSSVTAEWEMKMVTVHPSEYEWNFTGADKIANFCRENGIKLRGHNLLWSRYENWMLYDENGNFVDKETFYARQLEYFTVIMNRYKDVVSCWDVVNEPFNNEPSEEGEFHQDPVYELCGEEYVEMAFRNARKACPDAVLVLNECSLERYKEKQDLLIKWLKTWLSKGVPIDAVGIQGHINTITATDTVSSIERIICKLEDIGIKNIQITELDLCLYLNGEEKTNDIEDWKRDYQAIKYKKLFELFREHSDTITSVTFWGADDGHTHLNNYFKADEPLLFDSNHMPKQAYYAVCDF